MVAEEIRTVFNDSQFVAVLHYNDLKSQDWNDIRLKLDKHDITIKVIPTKVTRKVLKETKFSNLSPLFHGTTSLAFSEKPCINDLLKVIKNESKLYLLGGTVDNELMTAKTIENYAKMPSKDIVHSQLLTILSSQQTKLTRLLLDGGAGGLCGKLKQLSEMNTE